MKPATSPKHTPKRTPKGTPKGTPKRPRPSPCATLRRDARAVRPFSDSLTPISPTCPSSRRRATPGGVAQLDLADTMHTPPVSRSEERRVGKECRPRGARYHETERSDEPGDQRQ